MAAFFLFVSLFAICALIVGLIKPSIFARLLKFIPKRKIIALTFSALFVFSLIMVVIFAPAEKQTTQQNNQTTNNEIVKDETTEPVAQQTIVEKIDQTINKITEVVIPNQPIKQSPVVDSPINPQYTYYSVTDVVDGDTIKVNISGTQETLRLIGIDTPETVDPRKPVQCFGREASNKAKELLFGKKVRIEKDATQGELDKYGRTLAYVYRDDGLFYNKYMIEQGYAHEYTYNTPYKYQAEFETAEKYARKNLLGLWSPNTCNGDTTSAASTTTSQATATQTTGKYYTSSYQTSKYYYPETCSAWQSLSSSYLKSFDSLEALLAAYPSRTLSPQCQ
jgi:endonuclease YncB( thermonuclease family)